MIDKMEGRMKEVIESITKRVEANKATTEKLIPDLLEIYDRKENATKKLIQKMGNYRKVLNKSDERIIERIPDTVFCHQLFKKDGKIHNYLKHPRMNNMSDAERLFIECAIEEPWEFVICYFEKVITGSFLEMIDEVKDEPFVIYSPGIVNILKEAGEDTLFFFLRLFNGDCYETYGNIIYFRSIFPEDFIYFAKLQDSSVETMEDVSRHIEKHPLPYLFLINFCDLPLLVAGKKKELNVFCRSDIKYYDFDRKKLEKSFIIKEKDGIYHLTRKMPEKQMNMSDVYYNSRKKELTITSLTEEEFEKVSKYFSQDGDPLEMQYSAVTGMVHAASEILGKDKSKIEYRKLFETKLKPEEKEEMNRVNSFLSEVFTSRNEGTLIDIKKTAEKYGIHYEDACAILSSVENLFKKNGLN